MIWLSNSVLARLRDQLRDRGRRPSVAPSALFSLVGRSTGDGLTPAEVELIAIEAEYGHLCEAMYLMMGADGEIDHNEREVLKGALRNLSDDLIRGAHIEAMLEAAAKRQRAEGREVRLSEVIASLRQVPARAEVAFVLAAAIAFADNAIADEENETLNDLAAGLGIDESRANELLDEVEKDLTQQKSV